MTTHAALLERVRDRARRVERVAAITSYGSLIVLAAGAAHLRPGNETVRQIERRKDR
jgi:hypothetical protein